MPRFNLRKFTDPDQLRAISPSRLTAFLAPWKTYLANRGYALPDAGSQELDYAALARALMSPDPLTPVEMIDALYYVCEVGTLESIEDLHVKVAERGLHVPADSLSTAIDYVIDVWLVDPELIRTHHAEALALAQQNFDYYAGLGGVPRQFPKVPESARLAIEAALDNWFEEHKRGRGCRLMVFRQSTAVWIVVRHGRLMRREASHKDDGTPGTAFYRPQLHDVLIYDQQADEIAVHAETKGTAKLYLRVLGQHLFGASDYFPPQSKYTLAPLIQMGKVALECEDISGLEYITLVEYRIFWGGSFQAAETHRANDIFAAIEQRGLDRISVREPVMAAFKVKFENSSRERRVVIRTPASARYERNEDSETIETWMRARGFILPR